MSVPPLNPLKTAPDAHRGPGPQDVGLIMGGGGARAAYQVGFLRHLARHWPELEVPYITGVSAGAINAALLASHHGNFRQAVDELTHLWANLTVEDVFRTDVRSLLWNLLRWASQLLSGGVSVGAPKVRGLVDTQPLRTYLSEALHAVDGELTGIPYNLRDKSLRAVAITTTSYTTGQSVTWVQGEGFDEWSRPQRQARSAVLGVEHIMASAALPLLFPAVELEDEWYGDGGVRLTAPMSPVLHLGARRVIAISTRYRPTHREAEEPTVTGYPPPAQVAGVMLNAIFLDLLDHDAVRLERLNRLLVKLPAEEREGLHCVDLFVQRPSQDLGKLANQYEAQLPGAFRFLTRGLGTRETKSPDFLSLVMFQPDYLRALMEIGEADADANAERLAEFLDRSAGSDAASDAPAVSGNG